MTVFLAARRRAILAAVLGLSAAFAWCARRIGLTADLARSWVPVTISGLVLVVIFLPGMLGLVVRTGSYLGGVDQPTLPPGVTEPPGGEGPVPTRARSALYGASIDIAVDHFPLGVGLGRFGSHMSRVKYSPVYAEYGLTSIRGLQEDNANYITDTFWPMVLGEHGIIGLIGYAAFVAALAYRLWRTIGRQTDRLLRAFCMGTFAVFGSALIESLATPMFVAPPRAYIVFLVVGAVVAIAARQPVDTELSSPA
jgi:O-antigen ligase